MATPMTPTQWTAALKAEGVNVVGYKSWTTHGRDSATGKTFGPVNGVTIHHTAGRDSLALCYNGMSTLPGPLCHTHLSKTGVASMLSVRRANHAGTFAQNAHNAVLAESTVHPYPDSAEPVDGNDHYYGIEIENLGDGSDPYPLAQYQAAVKWATAICRHHGWTENSVIGHKEGTRRKIDPKGPVSGGALFTMDRFRAHIKAALALPAGQWSIQAATPATGSEEDVALSTDDVRKIFETDGILDAPDAATSTNKHWTAESYLSGTYKRAQAAETLAKGARADVAAARKEIAGVKAAVDGLATGGVDLDALAKKVADEIYRRLQS